MGAQRQTPQSMHQNYFNYKPVSSNRKQKYYKEISKISKLEILMLIASCGVCVVSAGHQLYLNNQKLVDPH